MNYRFFFLRDKKIACEIISTDLKSAKTELKRIMGDEYVEPFPDEIQIRPTKDAFDLGEVIDTEKQSTPDGG